MTDDINFAEDLLEALLAREPEIKSWSDLVLWVDAGCPGAPRFSPEVDEMCRKLYDDSCTEVI